MKIAVLYGGVSGEREVSLSSGKGIIHALKENNHEVVAIDFDPDRLDEIIELKNLKIDLVFIGLHGKFGEDGRIQGMLDMLDIPYVGSGVLASSLAMDKAKAKQVFEAYKIPVAKSNVYTITDSTDRNALADEINKLYTAPFVVKPNREGSTLGLTIVKNKNQVKEAIDKAAASDATILIEDFIKGKELTVPVWGAVGEEKALPVIEIIPKNDLYDYESKYTPGGSEHIIPAQIAEETMKAIQEYAVKAHQVLGCKTYSRVDFILTNEQVPVILEVNTLPGMTPTSLFPDAAKHTGISYDEMIETFVALSARGR